MLTLPKYARKAGIFMNNTDLLGQFKAREREEKNKTKYDTNTDSRGWLSYKEPNYHVTTVRGYLRRNVVRSVESSYKTRLLYPSPISS